MHCCTEGTESHLRFLRRKVIFLSENCRCGSRWLKKPCSAATSPGFPSLDEAREENPHQNIKKRVFLRNLKEPRREYPVMIISDLGIILKFTELYKIL